MTAVLEPISQSNTTTEPVQPKDSLANQFRDRGVLGPFKMYSPEEMGEIRSRLETEVLVPEKYHRRDYYHNRHLDDRDVHGIATHPAVLERMKKIYGNDLLLWRTNFFIKHPGGSDSEIPWHQDFAYWPIEPAIVISAWVAIDECTIDNSCVQIIPGSHRRIIPHIPSVGENMRFPNMADPEQFDESQAINMEMKPGEFFLFNERTLHHSFPNRSDKRRMGLAIRVVVPMVKVMRYDAPDHDIVVISGEDNMGFNRLTTPTFA